MTRYSLCSIIAAIVLPVALNAQSNKTEEVKDKAGQKAENRLDTRIDQGLDKGLNAVEGLFTKRKKGKSKEKASNKQDQQSTRSNNMPSSMDMSSMYGGGVQGEKLQAEDGYGDFVGSYTMTVRSEKNGKEEKDSPYVMEFHFNKNLMAIRADMENKDNLMVFNTKSQDYYMLMNEDGEKTGFKMHAQNTVTPEMIAESEDKDVDGKFERTGKTRVIDGRTCHQYLITSTEGNGEAWIDESEDAAFLGAMSGMSGQRNTQMNDDWKHIPMAGLMIESTWTDTADNRKAFMKTSNIIVGKVDESLFDMSEFQIMDMSAVPGMNGAYGR